MTIACLVFISLFLPNELWTAFGSWATALSAIFLVAQSIVLIDFGYTWNETWYKYALEARSRQAGAKGYRTVRSEAERLNEKQLKSVLKAF